MATQVGGGDSQRRASSGTGYNERRKAPSVDHSVPVDVATINIDRKAAARVVNADDIEEPLAQLRPSLARQ